MRTKQSVVLWLEPRIGGRLCILLLNYYLSLQCVCALNCSGIETAVATYPGGDINLRYGSPLEIYCSTEEDVRDLHFAVSGKQLSNTEIVNDTTIRLFVPHPPIHRTVYYCTNKATKKHCVNNVMVDTEPQDVTDFKCISNNLESLNCSWTPPNSNSDIKYNLSFYVNHARLADCVAERIRNTRYCIWHTNSQPRYRQTLATYDFNLLACNIFGCNSQNITVDHFAIVKPEKPYNLKVLNKNPHNVTLQWQVSANLATLLDCGIEHRIEYQIDKVDNQNVFHQVNTTMLPHKNFTYKFVLTNLPIAHMQYEVRIYIRSRKAVSEEFWSDFSFIFFQTPSEIPHRPPNMPAGSFFITPYHDKFRSIYVYWEQLEEFEECGDNFTYEITVSPDNKGPLYPDKKKSLSYVMLSNVTKGGFEVSVKSKNSNGTSVNSSQLYIPPQSGVLKGPSSFTKLAYANGTYELSWVNKELFNVDNYTLVWCKYVFAKLCDGRIRYTVLKDPNKTSHVVDLPGDERYNFAIAVNQGPNTSGLVWAKCDISKDAANYDIPVHLENSFPIDSSVEITWTMDCTLRDGIVTGYNLTYCPINETSNLCDNNVKNDPIHIPDPKTKKKNVTDLLYHRIYKFDFVLLTANGAIPIKDASKNVLMPEGTPSHPLNIKISNITHNSLVISYDPPEKKNGNIVVFTIYNNGTVFFNDTAGLPNSLDTSRRYTRLTNLKGFTNYTLNVQACNKHCSELRPSDAISIRTSIGPPSRPNPPTIIYDQVGERRLEWAAPLDTAGHVDMYQIKRVKEGEEYQIFNTTDNFLVILSNFCDGVSKYYLRAVNFDRDLHHGAATDNDDKVTLPRRHESDLLTEYLSEWSDPPTIVDCTSILARTILFLALFTLFIATVLGVIKLYRVRMRMKDIDVWLPEGLDKEINQYKCSGIQPSHKDDKLEEKSLLYDSKLIVPFPEVKQKDEHSGASDHTDSTVLSDMSRGPVDMEATTSEEGSDDSLEGELLKNNEKRHNNASSGSQHSSEKTLFGDVLFKKNPNTGYVQSIASPSKGYVPNNTMPFKVPPAKQQLSQPTTSSYVVASLETPTFTGVVPSITMQRPTKTSGYISHSDAQPKSFMNFPQLGASPTQPLVTGAVPISASLPISKFDADTFPLQTLDALSRLKAAKACASPGYVSAEEAALSKHLSLLSDSRLGGDDPAILEPDIMSPDAYCRFSWNVNPANDNLYSLHADPAVADAPKN